MPSGAPSAQRNAADDSPRVPAGGTATRLADGRWLVLGGEAEPGSARLWSADLRRSQPMAGPATGRAWHTATLLPDGSVLVFGGIDPARNFAGTPERFDPATHRFSSLDRTAVTPRAQHTATLLTDGRLLLVGGDAPRGTTVAEVWDPREDVALPIPASVGVRQRQHSARLLADGRVLVVGGGAAGTTAATIFDPQTDTFSPASGLESSSEPAAAVGSIPSDGAADVASDTRIAVRFGQPLDVSSLSSVEISSFRTCCRWR